MNCGAYHVAKTVYYFEMLNEKINAIEEENGKKIHKLQKQNSEYKKWTKKIDDKTKSAINFFGKSNNPKIKRALQKAEEEVISQLNIYSIRND